MPRKKFLDIYHEIWPITESRSHLYRTMFLAHVLGHDAVISAKYKGEWLHCFTVTINARDWEPPCGM